MPAQYAQTESEVGVGVDAESGWPEDGSQTHKYARIGWGAEPFANDHCIVSRYAVVCSSNMQGPLGNPLMSIPQSRPGEVGVNGSSADG